MRLEWELAKRGYRRYAAYPAATWAGILTNSVFGFIQAYVLLAIYETREDIGGYDATDALTYVWLAQAMIAAVGVFGWSDFAERIRSGDVATDLIRPVHPLRAGLAFDYGRGALPHALPRLAADGGRRDRLRPDRSLGDPVVWVVFLAQRRARDHRRLRVPLPLQPLGLLAARLPGVSASRSLSLAFFSGLYIPVSFFPDWLQTLAYLTPFPSMIQFPDRRLRRRHDRAGARRRARDCRSAGRPCSSLPAAPRSCAGTRKLVVQGG